MKASVETSVYGFLIVVLSGLLIAEGRENIQLRAAQPIDAQSLYRKISHSQEKLQILDVRKDVSANYEDIHIPGAIPYPDCDPSQMNEKVLERIFSYAPTIIVSNDGDPQLFARCQSQFKNALNLAGGITAWLDASLPEDSGQYVPPKSSSGGGCL